MNITNFYSTFSTYMLCDQTRRTVARVAAADSVSAELARFVRYDADQLGEEIARRLDDMPACRLAEDCREALAMIDDMLSTIDA